MGMLYRPGVWAQKYRGLSRGERDAINKQTNEIFAARTGVTRKLDPSADRNLCSVWLHIRDEVMAGKHNSILGHARQHASRLVSGITDAANATWGMVDEHLDQTDMPWMKIARRELNKDIKEIPGDEHNPEIMKYIRTCPELFSTENKRKYTEDNGEEGVKWCSAFVNWCMRTSGIVGTNNARALSWKNWGKPLKEPVLGAVVVTKTKGYRHVAFIEEVKGEFKMLGGNQKRTNGRGISDRVSIRPINYNSVVAYRWPIGR